MRTLSIQCESAQIDVGKNPVGPEKSFLEEKRLFGIDDQSKEKSSCKARSIRGRSVAIFSKRIKHCADMPFSCMLVSRKCRFSIAATASAVAPAANRLSIVSGDIVGRGGFVKQAARNRIRRCSELGSSQV
jgi:hypothetical protein